ncbi:MAG: type II toxin-antitoxin system RelE/ParE family toxin [Pyrinomonadaceae bacterium]
MVKVVWTNAVYRDLDEITEYIALDNPDAAERLARRVLKHVRQKEHPESGSFPRELERRSYIRQIVESPCRIFYNFDGKIVLILHVLRFERLLRMNRLEDRE